MKNEASFVDEAVSFARSAIISVGALELLILLRQDGGRSYRSDELVHELRSSELAVAQALGSLTKSGLVEEVPGFGYRYQQSSAPLDRLCQKLELAYAHKPVTIIRAILEAPDEKLRIFADAFRLSGKSK